MGNIFELCQKYLKKNIKLLIVYGILCLCSSIFAMISPYLSGNFIDCLVVTQSSKMIYRYCILFLFIAAFSQILGYLVNRLFTKLQTKLAFEFNKDMIGHVQKLSLSYINKQDMAYLNQRINNDTNMLITFCISIIQGIIINSLKLIVCFFLLINYSFYITILLIIILAFYIFTYRLLKNILFKARYMLTESQANYFSKLYEQLNNIIFIKVQAINNEFIQRLEKEFKSIFKVTLDYQKVNYIFSSMDSAVMSFAQICIFIMGGLSVIKGKLTIGQLTIILSYFNVMMESASFFFSLTKTIQENRVAYIRLKKIMDQQTYEENGEILQEINIIELKNITFAYSEKIIFQNFNYIFEKGNIYSIIGSNGSGKSTLIKLMLGLFNKEIGGEIYYNGKIIWKLNKHEIRKWCFGISEQEPILLPDTVKYNILLDDNKDLDLNELYYIAEKINLNTLLEKLPMGLETIINEKNSNFSGGEKQKISLARVFYKNPSVIIMDEPTSALDDKSSECLKNYLCQIKDDKIIIIITHNPIFLSISDYVINLEDQLEEKNF